MKNLISKILISLSILLISSACSAQIKNATVEKVKIYGNCGSCKKTIEKAGNIKNTAKVDWNKDTKMAEITFDPSKTNKDEILKRIAKAGYDSDEFRASDKSYEKLEPCCQYDRNAKPTAEPEFDKVKIEEKK